MSEEDEKKRIIKEAIREWLDSQFAAFGRYTFYGILSATLAAVVFFILYTQHLPWTK